MGQLLLKDNAASTLAVSLSAVAGSGQTVTIASGGSKFPTVAGTDWSFLTIFDGDGNIETMRVTAHASGSNSFTVSRGTSAGITGVTDADVKAWAAGTSTGVACRLVAQVVKDISDAASSAAASAAASAADSATAVTAVGNHLVDTSAAHAASAISYAGSANLVATDVEAALDELDAEKQPLDPATAKTNVAQVFSAKQTIAHTLKVQQVLEKVTNTGLTPPAAYNYDVLSQAIVLHGTAVEHYTPNFRGDASTPLNNVLATGEAVTVTAIHYNGASGFGCYLPKIDGNSSGENGYTITAKTLGGPVAAWDTNAYQAMTWTVFKIADKVFLVFISKSKYD